MSLDANAGACACVPVVHVGVGYVQAPCSKLPACLGLTVPLPPLKRRARTCWVASVTARNFEGGRVWWSPVAGVAMFLCPAASSAVGREVDWCGSVAQRLSHLRIVRCERVQEAKHTTVAPVVNDTTVARSSEFLAESMPGRPPALRAVAIHLLALRGISTFISTTYLNRFCLPLANTLNHCARTE